ncbi:MAG: WD40 repeat domain-containing protein [Desulfobacteraceae bacterium]|nr:WD40 repeat domain-containing protein [Desulfobacteraceae bacterium]MBC2756999.1 WD40 repeat domain-containing protein [Desulfobacteraceae bacterium]
MKRLFFILLIVLFSLTYGCNTMKAIEEDMSNLLEHMEADSPSSSDATRKGTDDQHTAVPESFLQSRENNSFNTAKKSKNEKYRLTIQVFPRESTIKVMNIKSRYYPGIRLAPGKYDILVEHEGHKTYREWVNVEYDIIVKVILKKKAEAYMTKSFDPIDKVNSTESAQTVSSEVEPDNSSEPLALVETDSADIEKINMSSGSGPVQFPSTLSGHYGSVSSLCFNPDGSLLASGSYDSVVILWKIDDGRVVLHLNHEDRVSAVAFSPDGNIVVSAGSDKAIKLWDVTTGELLKTLTGHTSRIHSVSFDLTGETIVSGGNNELIIWDVATGKIKNLIVGDDKLYPRFGTIKDIAFNPNGKDTDGFEFAFTCHQGVALFNPDNKQLFKLDDISTPQSVTYSADGTYIAWGTRHHHHKNDFFPRFVHTGTKEKDMVLSKDDELAKADRVFNTRYTPDGNYLVMLTYNQAVLYDIKTGTVIKKFNGTSETSVTDAALSPDGRILAASAKDVIKIWKID